MTYEAVRKQLGKKPTLLLGNGFSIAFSGAFGYKRLYDEAKKEGIGRHAEACFDHFGTVDFEHVLRLLGDAQWIGTEYGWQETKVLEADAQAVRNALATAVTAPHPERGKEMPTDRLAAAQKFLQAYRRVFTLNYDLLLYWSILRGAQAELLDDGFRPRNGALVFQGWDRERRLYYLHGALHLFRSGIATGKHSWSQSREALSEAVRSQIEQGNHPLIVAEGASEKKIERIRESPYLNACFTELGATASRLVTLGVSFSEQDEHVAEAIAENTGIRTVFVGVHGGLDSADGTALVARVKRLSERRGQLHPKKPLHLHYFDSATAKVWG
ncbi:MAG: DUF4917 family protein [Sandaracinaceae bacterium]|nr:DUF4917 family protein [Sandaracinaceae bacterium]